jgi:hypothetical protein
VKLRQYTRFGTTLMGRPDWLHARHTVVDANGISDGQSRQPFENESLDKASSAISRICTSPRLKVGRISRTDNFAKDLLECGVLRLPWDQLSWVIDSLQALGAERQFQYESVRTGDENPLVLETRASTNGPEDATSASKSKPTRTHQDGYQFWSLYRGQKIAGIGNMPTIEVLGYPEVHEVRVLTFSDLTAAGRELISLLGVHYFRELMRPVFFVNPIYRQLDPTLGDAGRFPILYCDRVDGWRFHVGGGIKTEDPEAAFALGTFRRLYDKYVTAEVVQEKSLYVIYQPRVAHAGERLTGVDGGTVLHRELLRFKGRK